MLRIVNKDLLELARDVAYGLRKAWPASWRGRAHGLHLQTGGWSARNKVPPLPDMGSYVQRIRTEPTRTLQWPYEPGLWLVAYALASASKGDPLYIRKRARSFLLDARRGLVFQEEESASPERVTLAAAGDGRWYGGRMQGMPLRPLSEGHFRQPTDDLDRLERHFADVMFGPPAVAGRGAKGTHRIYDARGIGEWWRTWAATPGGTPAAILAAAGLYALVWWHEVARPYLGYGAPAEAWNDDPYAGHPQGLSDTNDSNGAPAHCYLTPWHTRTFRMMYSRGARGWYTEDRGPGGDRDWFVAFLEPGDFDGWDPAQRAAQRRPEPADTDEWRYDWIATRERGDVKRWGDTATALRKITGGPLPECQTAAALDTWRRMYQPAGTRRDGREIVTPKEKRPAPWCWGDPPARRKN